MSCRLFMYGRAVLSSSDRASCREYRSVTARAPTPIAVAEAIPTAVRIRTPTGRLDHHRPPRGAAGSGDSGIVLAPRVTHGRTPITPIDVVGVTLRIEDEQNVTRTACRNRFSNLCGHRPAI